MNKTIPIDELPCDPPEACATHGRCWTHSTDVGGDDPEMVRARRINALRSLAQTWIDRGISRPNASAEALTAGEALQEALSYIPTTSGGR